MFEQLKNALDIEPMGRDGGSVIGESREGRPISAFRLGRGARRVSLLGGCHADEPVGPRMLRHLVAYLSSLEPEHPLLCEWEWWVIPHVNPDGQERNRGWQGADLAQYDLGDYLAHVVRERPGDDIEFGFPRSEDDRRARPENRAAYDWWRTAAGAFALHISFHGMAFAAGPWFLIDADWRSRVAALKDECARAVAALGYALHDVERNGEKGFVRLGRGFCTRPDSVAMREHFLSLNDRDTAALFRPSSMETIRSLGGDALTLVSEMPIFITPGVGVELGPPDLVGEEWKAQILNWQQRIASGESIGPVTEEAHAAGLRAMPIRDQMSLQLTLLSAGLKAAD